MSKKITKEEFLQRFYRNYPEAEIEILEYTAISNKAKIKCKKCGKEYVKSRAREILNHYNCCISNETKISRLISQYKKNNEWTFIKQCDKDHYIVRHEKCGNELKRVIGNALDNPFACTYCETIKYSNMLPLNEVQQQLDQQFSGTIKILDYNGQLEKNHYKCLKCGLIFVQQHISLLQSRGCPKCDRFKSLGEKKMASLLKSQNLSFKEQFSVDELPLQKFDFAVLNEEGKIQYFIEVQGEQHYKETTIFRDSLKKIQEHDNRKRKYCKEKNIPLYEIIYKKGKLLNLDILPINSTTISVKESTP